MILVTETLQNASRLPSDRVAWGHLLDVRPLRSPFLYSIWMYCHDSLSSLDSIPFPEVVPLSFEVYGTRMKYM